MDGDCQMLMRYNLCYLSLLLLVNCWPWMRELPPVRVRVYSRLIYALTVCLFQIYWSCMYFKFNCMLSNYVFQQHLCFNHLFLQGFISTGDLTCRRGLDGLHIPHLQDLLEEIVPWCSTKEESKSQYSQASNTLSLSSSFKILISLQIGYF